MVLTFKDRGAPAQMAPLRQGRGPTLVYAESVALSDLPGGSITASACDARSSPGTTSYRCRPHRTGDPRLL
jgi:hypothetical protein